MAKVLSDQKPEKPKRARWRIGFLRAALLTIANGEQLLDEYVEHPENWWPVASACAKSALLTDDKLAG
jgi:hypothetical protein